MVDEEKKETKDLSWWEVSFIFLIGLGIGSFIMFSYATDKRSNELENAYRARAYTDKLISEGKIKEAIPTIFDHPHVQKIFILGFD